MLRQPRVPVVLGVACSRVAVTTGIDVASGAGGVQVGGTTDRYQVST